MQFRNKTLIGIREGKIRIAFRKWRRPYVKAGGTMKTWVGLLSFESVEPVKLKDITTQDANAAGHESLEELRRELQGTEGEVFKIRFRLAGPDPRIELRNEANLGTQEWADLEKRLVRMDRASKTGPWSRKTLELISTHEGVRAGDLAQELGLERDKFKINVRKLKNLGFTESLGTGYRISPRGRAFLKRMRAPRGETHGVVIPYSSPKI